MITYTYEPLIGITSQSDINNRITTYEYDGLGRLSLIRDQDGNIIKKYQYAYQSVNPGGSTACSTSNCTGVDEKCVNGFCEKAKRINTSTVLVKSGTNAGKWKCSFYYQWSDASTSPANALPDDNSVPARKAEYNLFPCDIIQP
jgi:YD repeat-containing protein